MLKVLMAEHFFYNIFTFEAMFIYNVTCNVDEEIKDSWLKWMREEHIPQVMNTGCFTGNQILKVHTSEDDGLTFSIQYHFFSMQNMETYQKDFAPALQADHKKKFGEKVRAFRTLLEIVA